MDMDALVNGEGQPDPKDVAAEPTQADQPVEQPAVEGAPSAPAADSHVPLAALEAERKQRKDHKERADRAEERLRVYEEQARQSPSPQQPVDPLQSMQQQMVNDRFNNSEAILRSRLGDDADVDAKVGVFMEAARANPALSAALQQQRHPWEFAYKEGQRMLMLREVGDDPAAYRAKVEAEVRASLEKSTAPALKVPQSLNGVRSVAPRAAPAWNGPTPLDAIVNNR